MTEQLKASNNCKVTLVENIILASSSNPPIFTFNSLLESPSLFFFILFFSCSSFSCCYNKYYKEVYFIINIPNRILKKPRETLIKIIPNYNYKELT